MILQRQLTVAGLVVGAAGIAGLWAAGVDFPVAVPPGLVILLVGAVIVIVVRSPWALALGALLGLFVTVGFLASPTGIPNLRGDSGAAVAVSQAVQQVGVVTALVSGILGFRRELRGRSVVPGETRT